MTVESDEGLEMARDLLERASHVVVFSGAGMSAESGVPTFRGPGGLWKNFRPEQLATPSAFAADPRLVWEWYDWRRQLVIDCEPNQGHTAIAAAQASPDCDLRVLTQNVDGLHELALERSAAGGLGGGTGDRITELHGSLFRIRCSECTYARPDREPLDTTSLGTLPRCPECGALLRPAVVWFGESLDAEALDRSFSAAGRADVCVVVGTSGVVEPAASLPRATSAAGGVVIEVNLEPTPLTAVADILLRGPAAHWLPRLFGPLWKDGSA